MKNVIELLYDLPPYKDHAPDSTFVRTARIRLETMELLHATMTNEQKQLLDAYFQASSKVDTLLNFDHFRYALHLGAQLMAELIEGRNEILQSSSPI